MKFIIIHAWVKSRSWKTGQCCSPFARNNNWSGSWNESNAWSDSWAILDQWSVSWSLNNYTNQKRNTTENK